MNLPPHFSCWFCGEDIAAGVLPFVGVLGKPMCHTCRCEMDGEFARQQSRWSQQDLQESRSMDLVRSPSANYHD